MSHAASEVVSRISAAGPKNSYLIRFAGTPLARRPLTIVCIKGFGPQIKNIASRSGVMGDALYSLSQHTGIVDIPLIS
jgi:hypothetical protein